MFWVNGLPQTHISLGDRSFQYGDGCFTTIKTKKGELEHWQAHVEATASQHSPLSNAHAHDDKCACCLEKRRSFLSGAQSVTTEVVESTLSDDLSDEEQDELEVLMDRKQASIRLH